MTEPIRRRRKLSRAERRARSLARPAVDLRHLFADGPPQQGPRPVCLPLSLAGAHEAYRSGLGRPPEPLAPEPLWAACLRDGLAGVEGTTLAATARALEYVGQPSLTAWPYNPALGAGTESPPGAAGPPPWRQATSASVALRHDAIEDPIEAALEQGRTPVLVVEVTEEFEVADENGEIDVPPITAEVGDYHSVLVVGVASGGPSGRRRLLVRNSWGPGWGAGGYGWLPMEYLVAFAVQAAEVTGEF